MECSNNNSNCKVMWAVMMACKWDSIITMGCPLQCPSDGPQRFIPVFDTKEQAIKWNGSDKNIVMLSSFKLQ